MIQTPSRLPPKHLVQYRRKVWITNLRSVTKVAKREDNEAPAAQPFATSCFVCFVRLRASVIQTPSQLPPKRLVQHRRQQRGQLGLGGFL